MSENDIAVSPWPALFTLIDVDGVEVTGAVQGVVHPLIVPPLVGMIGFSDIGVIGGSEKIDLGQVIGVAEVIYDASVEPRPAVGNVGMAVDVAPIESIGLTVHGPLVAFEGRSLGSLVRMR